jgi:TetR/AcrR family transcriptional regulator
VDRAYTDDRDAAAQIRAAGLEFLRFYQEHPEPFRLLAFPPVGSAEGADDVRERTLSGSMLQNARLARALRAGIEEGTVKPLDPEAVATVLWSAWSGVIALAWRPDSLRVEPSELERLISLAMWPNLLHEGHHSVSLPIRRRIAIAASASRPKQQIPIGRSAAPSAAT